MLNGYGYTLKKKSCFAHVSGDYRHATSKFTKKSECFCIYDQKTP